MTNLPKELQELLDTTRDAVAERYWNEAIRRAFEVLQGAGWQICTRLTGTPAVKHIKA